MRLHTKAKRWSTGSCVALFFLSILGIGEAQAQTKVPQHFFFEVRGFWSDPFQSKIEANVPGPFASVNFKEDLGFGSEWGALVRGVVKITPGHRFRIGYQRVEYTGTIAMASRDIEFGGVTIPEGSAIRGALPLEKLKFVYSYLFRVGTDRFRVGPMINAAHISIDPSLSAQVPGQNLEEISVEVDGWGGTIGGEFDSYLSESTNLYGFAGWIGAGDLDGSWDVEFGLRHFFTPWLGISAAYRYSGNKLLLTSGGAIDSFLRVQTNNLSIGVVVGF